MNDNEKKRDKKIWQRMGLELATLHDLIVTIRVDKDYQAVMDVKTWDKLGKLNHYLDIVRSDAEERMAQFVPDWSKYMFYPRERTVLHNAIETFRNQIEREAKNEQINITGNGQKRNHYRTE